MPRKHTPSKHLPFQLRRRCSSKRAFATEKDAQEAAELQMLVDMQLTLSVYQCSDCGKWHLTRQEKNQ